MAAESLCIGRPSWGEDDCVSFALPALDRESVPELRPTEMDSVREAARKYGSLKDAWREGLRACGYVQVPLEVYQDGDRVLGRDAMHGPTVAVVKYGVPWIRAAAGLTRPRWRGPTELWRAV